MTPSGAFNLHLVSDSSGETVTNIVRACLVQYDDVEVTEHFWWLVRTPGQMTRVIEGLKAAPGLVIFTLLDAKIRQPLEAACRELKIPCVSALDPVKENRVDKRLFNVPAPVRLTDLELDAPDAAGEGGVGAVDAELGLDHGHHHHDRPQADAADRADEQRDQQTLPGVARFDAGFGGSAVQVSHDHCARDGPERPIVIRRI